MRAPHLRNLELTKRVDQSLPQNHATIPPLPPSKEIPSAIRRTPKLRNLTKSQHGSRLHHRPLHGRLRMGDHPTTRSSQGSPSSTTEPAAIQETHGSVAAQHPRGPLLHPPHLQLRTRRARPSGIQHGRAVGVRATHRGAVRSTYVCGAVGRIRHLVRVDAELFLAEAG